MFIIEQYFKTFYGQEAYHKFIVVQHYGVISNEVSIFLFLKNYIDFELSRKRSKAESNVISFNGKKFVTFSILDLRKLLFNSESELRTALNNCIKIGVIETYSQNARKIYYRIVPEGEIKSVKPDRNRLAGLFDDLNKIPVDSKEVNELSAKLPKRKLLKKSMVDLDTVETFTADDYFYFIEREFTRAKITTMGLKQKKKGLGEIVKTYDADTLRKAVRYVTNESFTPPARWEGIVTPTIVTTAWLNGIIAEVKKGEEIAKKDAERPKIKYYNLED